MNSTRLKYLGALLAGAALVAGGQTLLGLTAPKPGDVMLSEVTVRPRYFPGTPLPDGGTFTDVKIQYEVCGQPVGADGGLLPGSCAEYIVAPGSTDEKTGAALLQNTAAKAAVKKAIQR